MRRGPVELDPWMVPVPVRTSTFVPLDRAHAPMNLEVDLAAIGAFFSPRARQIAAADFQLLPDGVSRGRLGAGRAVHVRGHYLKGVGRTPLAANWRVADDARHATGHLFASAAVREYLVSRHAEARGIGDAIVPCTGVLFRPLPAGARPAIRAGLGSGPVPAIDLRFQAISVKPAGFARLSNFSWALHQLDVAHAHIVELMLLFQRYLDPTTPVDPAACTPTTMTAALVAAIDRGFANFERYFAAGVNWGYLDNNVTADGRFLDLEVPAVLGGPCLGVLHTAAGATGARASDRWVGLDALDFARRVQIFVEDLGSRLRFIAGSCAIQHAMVRQFAAALADELDRAIPRGHRVRSPRALATWTAASIARTLDLGATGRRALREVIDARQRYVADQTDGAIGGPLRDTPLRLAIHAPGVQRYLRQPTWAPPLSPGALEEATRYNDAVRRVDQARSIDELFAELRRARAAIAR
ncbi:MAG: hypothetical protein K8W52_05425 [Deltaproteobacteria bacterium]|nr:hypothetical protein [Deltaproteobacteria bacterium]